MGGDKQGKEEAKAGKRGDKREGMEEVFYEVAKREGGG